MKLYTIVEDKEVLITSCNNNLKVGLKEYSYEEYLSFMEEVKKYIYISLETQGYNLSFSTFGLLFLQSSTTLPMLICI